MPWSISALVALPRREAPRALLMFASLLLVVTSFWILKPLRKARFIEHYDRAGLSLLGRTFRAADAELGAKLLQVGLAALLTVAFVRLARRHQRQTLVAIIGGAFAALFAALAAVAQQTSTAFVWVLYSAGDLYATLMVAALFACLHDLSTTDGARRSYGVIGLGAVLGGVIGSQLTARFSHTLPLSAWLALCSALTLGAVACTVCAPGRPAGAEASRCTAPSADDRAVHEGRTPLPAYIASLALLVGLYEVISTLLDYQFTATLAHALDGGAIGRQLARAFALMNATALFVQLFITTPLLQKHGPEGALLLLPCTLLCASFGMLVVPSVPMASLVPALDSGFAYSVHQSAKETLYVPLAPAHKYHAKALIDVLVLRCAKAAGLVLCLGVVALGGVSSGPRTLPLLTLALVVPFGLCALHAGRRRAPSPGSRSAARRSVTP